jgi:predicted DNA-binding transcriptional regulator AlpA
VSFSASTASHSSEAQSRRRPSYTPTDPLLTAREAAAETGRALSTFYRDLKSGALPQPCVMVGRSPRWRRSILRAALGIAT